LSTDLLFCDDFECAWIIDEIGKREKVEKGLADELEVRRVPERIILLR
jgi:hypothetical protein